MNLPKLQETIDIPKELPISRLVLNIPRSYSLDDHVLRYHRRRHLQLNKEDEEGLSRSFSVGTKEEMNHPFDAPIHSAEQYSYPDTTHTTEAPPLLDHEIRIPNQYGTIHAMAVQGSVIVIGTSHNHIHAFHIQEISEALFSTVIPSPITIPVASNTLIDSIRCLCFSPTFRDTAVVWAGTENGSILAKHMETGEVRTRKITDYPINHILRHRNTELWTMDTAGNLTIWPMSIEECFSDTLPEHFRVRPCIHHVALSNNRLWTCLEKTVDCFDRTTGSVVSFTIDQETVGEIVQLMVYPDTIYTVHATGQINIWDETTFEKKQCVSISTDQITTAVTVDTHYVWIGFLNGSIAIYNTKSDPWITVKVWHAHTHAVTHLEVDALSSTTVVSMDVEGHIAVWDGLLSDYWIVLLWPEQHMLTRVNDYCTFSPIQAMICSWNMDAVKPEALTDIDKEKILEWLNGMQSPDIIMIGVQEIVDLGSKTLTAKSLLSISKKIETIEEADELLTHRYMLWYDYFKSAINTNFGENSYKIIKTDQLVGLFTCLFVKTEIEPRIHQCDSTVVKTGFRVMNKSLHGNKGGIVVRLLIDDTSLCFINCHLAAGQCNLLSRNADMDGILHSAQFSACIATDQEGFPDPFLQQVVFKNHSDGSHVLDHETCFFSGDLNYRVELPREDVLKSIETHPKLEAWETLQQYDQLKQQQATNPMFRCLGFKEAPILFDPTYKYERGTEEYDTSEKKRVPAWCDRILYRAPANVTNVYYRRHEVKASDHRPVSAGFTFPVKTIDHAQMNKAKEQLQVEWKLQVFKHTQEAKVRFVMHYDLCDEKEAWDRLDKSEWDAEKVVMDLYRDKGACIA